MSSWGPDLPFACGVCPDRAFRNRISIAMHIRKRHPELAPTMATLEEAGIIVAWPGTPVRYQDPS